MSNNGPYDVFGPDWGLGLPIEWFDQAAIAALLTNNGTSHSVVDQLVLGWDGEEVNAWDVIRTLLRSRGYFIGNNAQGLITFARLRLPNITDAADPTTVAPIPGPGGKRVLNLEPAEGEGVDRLVGTIGALPWSDGLPFEVNAIGDSDALNPPNSLRSGLFAARRSVELDLSALSPSGTNELPFDLVSYLALRGFGAPRLSFVASDPGNIAHGDMLKLGDPDLKDAWFVDADGDAIAVDASARWFGQVVAFRRDLEFATIELVLLLQAYNLNKFARLRAPNAVVASVASNVYTVDANNFFDESDAPGTYRDAGGFTVDDYVEIWSEDGVRISGTAATPDVQQITVISGNDITLDAAWTVPPTAGDVIRMAHLDTVNGNPEADSPRYPNVVPYVYMAGVDGFINPNDDESHIYSYSVR